MKRRGVSGREVTISFRGKIIKMDSQRKNERFDDIYRANTIFKKIIFNIRIQREVRNVADMMQFNWASILR